MKTLQDYIDKLNSLNFKEMYNNDFFWTWDKTDEELEAVFTVVPVSPSLLPATFLDLKYRIWTRRNPRLHTVRPFVRQPTWYLSWLM